MSSPSQTTVPPSPAIDAVIARYGALSGDEAAFATALSRPLAPCVWAHPLRLTRDRLTALLAEENIASEVVEWSETALRLEVNSRPGLTWLYRAGLMQIQEESAMLPVRLLDPQPGERILDLCAAPGNKTAQIALALGNRGTVVANDRTIGRLAPLHAAISRLGLMNVTTTAHNGATYPAGDASFDKVLVDAPCSGEGTMRKGAGKHKPVPDGFRRRLNALQYALLSRAVDLCRPGGRIVYSTCTIAPDENEAIIDRILTERAEDFRVVAATIPGLRTSPGITSWQGRRFATATSRSIRLWPHRADTSGFFAVVLERAGRPAKNQGSDLPRRPCDDAGGPLAGFIEQFGLPASTFEPYRLLGNGNQRRLVASDHCLPENPPAAASGLALTRDKARVAKLSTQAALAFGAAATRNAVDLDRAEVDRFMGRDSLRLAPGRVFACDDRAYVVARHRGFALGIGRLRAGRDAWELDSMFPKRRG